MINWLWLVPALPLAGAAVNAVASRKMPRRLVSAIGVGSVGAAFVFALLAFLALEGGAGSRVIQVPVYTWIPVGGFTIDFALLLDPLSALMILVVTGVGFLIHVYSTGYMADDESYGRFFTYLNLFVFSMLVLVLGSNYLVMYVGWELVGLCSYLLISFWFTRPSAAAAGKKAFITTRIGDFGFGLGVILIFVTFGSLNFADVFARAPQMFQAGAPVVTAITLLLFAGAVGKSAQLPLYVWLPDAMEGPTPVSALIHAATMVTAGVYMVARSHVLFSLAPLSSEVVAAVGAVTALFAATIALVQMDLKRVLAYSTISQLGYMFLGVGVAAYGAGVFHLMTHAFFKALLFLAAGSVMHAMNGVIDMRQLGGLRSKMRWTYLTFFAAALAISGFPLFSGFFSKDEILSQAYETGHTVLWAIGLITAGLTAFYIFRALFLTFHGTPRWQGAEGKPAAGEHAAFHPHESPPSMTVPLMILAVLSVVAVSLKKPRVLGPSALEGFFAPVFGEAGAVVPAVTEWLLIGASVAAGLIGIVLAYWFYIASPEIPGKLAAQFRGIYDLLWNKYYIDELYSALFVEPGRRLAMFLWQTVDVQVIDGSANGLGRAFAALGGVFRGWQTGYARMYALMMLVGTVLVIAWMVWR
ncbi:MAG: NADH-quinone oxidoreductase subunit L [Chloroflexi bacterium]|nr:NADH-quinone oxidoreductase subunit L [Chloroflexota bacterium]